MSVRTLVITITAIVLVSTVGLTTVYVRRESAKAAAKPNAGQTQAEAAAAALNEGPRPLLEIEEFALEHHEQGQPTWKVRLNTLRVETGGRAVSAGRLKEGLVYGRDGKPAVRLTADHVKYDTASYDFDVQGNVRVVSPKGAIITTEKVHWENESRMITTPGLVVLRTKDKATITTAGIRFDTSTQTVYAPNQVRLETERSDCVGQNLIYPLDTGKWELDDIQMVVDVDEAKERTGRN